MYVLTVYCVCMYIVHLEFLLLLYVFIEGLVLMDILC